MYRSIAKNQNTAKPRLPEVSTAVDADLYGACIYVDGSSVYAINRSQIGGFA
jgi:hypothetical protein